MILTHFQLIFHFYYPLNTAEKNELRQKIPGKLSSVRVVKQEKEKYCNVVESYFLHPLTAIKLKKAIYINNNKQLNAHATNYLKGQLQVIMLD